MCKTNCDRHKVHFIFFARETNTLANSRYITWLKLFWKRYSIIVIRKQAECQEWSENKVSVSISIGYVLGESINKYEEFSVW